MRISPFPLSRRSVACWNTEHNLDQRSWGTLRKLYFYFRSHWMGYDRGDSYPFHLVQNRMENYLHDHIPINVKANRNIVFSVYIYLYIKYKMFRGQSSKRGFIIFNILLWKLNLVKVDSNHIIFADITSREKRTQFHPSTNLDCIKRTKLQTIQTPSQRTFRIN